MPMRVLLIDAAAKARIADVLRYAEAHQQPAGSDYVPGDHAGHVCRLGDYRCVFSFTETEQIRSTDAFLIVEKYRHLSISVDGSAPRTGAHPAAAFMIATEFGFTGWDGATWTHAPDGWQIGLDKLPDDRSVVILAQAAGAPAGATIN